MMVVFSFSLIMLVLVWCVFLLMVRISRLKVVVLSMVLCRLKVCVDSVVCGSEGRVRMMVVMFSGMLIVNSYG